jgi:hypothetical protein
MARIGSGGAPMRLGGAYAASQRPSALGGVDVTLPVGRHASGARQPLLGEPRFEGCSILEERIAFGSTFKRVLRDELVGRRSRASRAPPSLADHRAK